MLANLFMLLLCLSGRHVGNACRVLQPQKTIPVLL